MLDCVGKTKAGVEKEYKLIWFVYDDEHAIGVSDYHDPERIAVLLCRKENENQILEAMKAATFYGPEFQDRLFGTDWSKVPPKNHAY
jgi:hypothetical protein